MFAGPVAGLFFPLRTVLRIDGRDYSPAVLDKIVTAGGDCKSFQHAARQLEKLAEVPISKTHVSTLTHQIGRELIAVRDREAELHRYRQLPADANQPPVELACVETDGARLMTRAPHQSRGVHEEQWKEPKVGVLWRMTGEAFADDPHPELPRCFQDPKRVPELVREIHGGAVASPKESEPDRSPDKPLRRTADLDSSSPTRESWQPQRIFRTCVATLHDVYGFGPLVAAEAQKRGFYQAQRKVFVADGQDANWTVHRLHFPEFTAVTDFMHAVAYVYAAAQAMTSPDQLWPQYLRYATACWQGRTEEMIAELEPWLAAHPLPKTGPLKEISSTDPRKIVHEALTYLRNNRERMKYPEYRRMGLPVTSSLVESLIKEINWRVKGTEKFWNRPELAATSRSTSRSVGGRERELPDQSAESILQVRAALLSDNHRLEKHIHSRPGSPFVRRTPQANTSHAM